ncbi:MAG: LysR family transcriptional regulator [Betaproteobacteria bacterium]
MQFKWLEDWLALAATRSFKNAAEQRPVTAPAFGRRIRALEAWFGVALFVRGSQPLMLTPAGEQLAQHARAATADVDRLRLALQGNWGGTVVRLVTGRALAHGVVADALTRLACQPAPPEVQVLTRLMPEAGDLLERDAADLMLGYQHPALALRLDGRRYLSARVADDRLLPVVRARAGGAAAHAPGHARLLAYDPAQALGRLLDDHIAHLDGAPPLPVLLRSDSVDSLREYVLRGLGVAWLPLSMVAADLEAGRLASWADPRLAIDFEIRLFRRKRLASPALQRVWDAFVPPR